MKISKFVLGILVFSVLPVWRLAGTKSDAGEGMTLWEYFYWATRPEYIYRFIPVEEAISKAQKAYEETKLLSSA